MNRILLYLIPAFTFLAANPAVGQTFSDELAHVGIETEIDSTLFGRNLYSVLPHNVEVVQDASVQEALNKWIYANVSSDYNGFRVRIYLSSNQNAREESQRTLLRFNAMFPFVQAYRSYSSPNFKVSVGNCRTRVEAEQLLRLIKDSFPEAFIVRERFKYPTIGNPDLRQYDNTLDYSDFLE